MLRLLTCGTVKILEHFIRKKKRITVNTSSRTTALTKISARKTNNITTASSKLIH